MPIPPAHCVINEASIKAATGQFDLESVYKLQMPHMGIRKIEGLALLPNLTELDLSSNHISKIEGLARDARAELVEGPDFGLCRFSRGLAGAGARSFLILRHRTRKQRTMRRHHRCGSPYAATVQDAQGASKTGPSVGSCGVQQRFTLLAVVGASGTRDHS